jgi:hypothetical protein
MGRGYGHVTPKRVLHSNFGCCIGTIAESAAYQISGALERRKFLYANLLILKASCYAARFDPRAGGSLDTEDGATWSSRTRRASRLAAREGQQATQADIRS